MLGLFANAAARIRVDAGVDDALFAGLAAKTDGFSGREISKLWVSVQGYVYGRGGGEPVMDRKALDDVLGWKLAEHTAMADFQRAIDANTKVRPGATGSLSGEMQ